MRQGECGVVSFSEIDTYRQCPFKWWLEYRDEWQPPTVSPALQRGSLWHEVMAAHYGMPDTKRQREIEALLYADDGSQSEMQQLVAWMYSDYGTMWADADREWKVLAVEQRINNVLHIELDGHSIDIRLTGIVDLVVRDRKTKMLWLVDHKSHRDFPPARKLELDDQMGLYAWLLRQLGKPVQGIIYSVARTQRNKSKPQTLEERYKRYPLHKTDAELDEIVREAALTEKRKQQIGSRSEAERNTGDHCIFRCSFTEPCLAARKGIDIDRFLRGAGFTKGGRR